jgi:ABC-type glycerol-3-phosphate transport system substrate-binding protein
MKGNFQIIIIVVFIALAIFGVLVFSGAIPIGSNNTPGGQGTITLWGTVNTDMMTPPLEQFNTANQTYVVKYVQKSAGTFDQDLLEALASGTGPDMVFLPDNLAYHYSNKLFTIPYSSYPLASFKANFASAGEVFLTDKGILAFPISIDPLVMYYNRSTLNANGIVYPPATWDDLSAMVPTLTQKDNSNKILKSAVALGDFSNVTNAKDIISAMFMQTGNPIVVENNGIFNSALSNTSTNPKYNPPSVLQFYTSFTDPSQSVYTWNKSFPNSADSFSSENTAFYFGFASELKTLINKNPNQDFFVAPFPQIKGASAKVTGARVMGIALLSSSKNFNTAFTAASAMATGTFASQFATALGVAPARRDLLAVKQIDAYSPTFYSSALYAKSWLDPSPSDTNTIFSNMIEGVLSNSMSTSGAVSDASSKLDLLLRK